MTEKMSRIDAESSGTVGACPECGEYVLTRVQPALGFGLVQYRRGPAHARGCKWWLEKEPSDAE